MGIILIFTTEPGRVWVKGASGAVAAWCNFKPRADLPKAEPPKAEDEPEMKTSPMRSAPLTKIPVGKGRRSVRMVRLLLMGVLLAVSACVQAGAPAPALHRFTFTEYHMGVDSRLVVYAASQSVAETACTAAFARIAQLDSIMSDYQVRSELSRLSDHAGSGPMPVSNDLFKALKQSQKMARLSGGMFDITVGPLVKLWRKARKTHILPAPEEIAKARKLVGWKNLTLDEPTHSARLAIPGMRLDLGAVGKGFAGDEAQKVFEKFGIKNALVEMGGNLVVSGAPPGTSGWSIEVPNGMKYQNGDVIAIRISGLCAISTSGDTEQFVEIGGKHYSHVINPLTGQALTQRVQATVITSTGLVGDPLAAALTLVRPRVRRRLLRAYPGAKAFVRVLK